MEDSGTSLEQTGQLARDVKWTGCSVFADDVPWEKFFFALAACPFFEDDG